MKAVPSNSEPEVRATRARAVEPSESTGCPPLEAILSELAARGCQPLAVHYTRDGLELIPSTPADGRPNRARIRVFRIAAHEGTTSAHAGKFAALFYKPSAVPYSLDRYSYGAVLFEETVDAARVRPWLAYAESRFDPQCVPPDLRRAIPIDVPEFEPVDVGAAAISAGEEGRGSSVGSTKDRSKRRVARKGAKSSVPPVPLNPCELEIDLFCLGVRIDPLCGLETDARVLSRTRAGLGSGLELIIPGSLKDIWMNVPVEEDFVQHSPYRLVRFGPDDYRVVDERSAPSPWSPQAGGFAYPVRLPGEPSWYRSTTRSGTSMSRIGVMQGTYLGIYLSNSCGFWYHKPEAGCLFCTTGLNVGVNEAAEKLLEDVVDVARAAKEESGNTFVHFNSGYHGGDKNLEVVAPYVKAVKEQVGALIGVQVVPSPNLWKYDWLIDLGANHFSFCYEFHNPEYFKTYCPGKAQWIGQEAFFRAMEYCVRRLGKGSCSGEIIAGVEPIEDTLRAIDFITEIGAFPTVCIFRPTIGAAMERHPSPRPEDMVVVMRHMYEACVRRGIPIGMAPNIEVSLIVNPDDARYLVPRDWKVSLYEARMAAMRRLAAPFFARELRRRKIRGSATDPSAYQIAGLRAPGSTPKRPAR